MTSNDGCYVLPPIRVTGGAGGEVAHTEDLRLAAWALEEAAREVDQSERQVKAAQMWADKAIPDAIEQVRPQLMEAQRAAYEAGVQVGGFADMTIELEEAATKIAAVGKAYEEAEAQAYQGVSRWTRMGRGMAGAFGLTLWTHRMIWGNVLRFTPADWASRVGGRPGLASAVRPDGLPRLTGLIGGASVASFLWFLDRQRLLPFTPSVYDGALWAAARGTSQLEAVAGEPRYEGVVPSTGTSMRPQAQGVADLVQGIADTPFGDHGGVTIDTIVNADGSRAHVVNIPGTRDTTFTDPSPNDWNSNFYVTGNEDSDAARMVRDAMVAAGIKPDEPVMLSGHSQGGGIAAYVAASDFAQDYNVTHVVTFGAAPDRIPVVKDVQYLQATTTQDPTPGADASYPADLPNVTTAELDLQEAADPAIRQLGDSVGGAHSLAAHHAIGQAVDASDDASLVAWRATTTDFLGDGEVSRRVFKPTFEAAQSVPEPSIPPPAPVASSTPAPAPLDLSDAQAELRESIERNGDKTWLNVLDSSNNPPLNVLDLMDPSVGGVLPLRP